MVKVLDLGFADFHLRINKKKEKKPKSGNTKHKAKRLESVAEWLRCWTL